MIASKANVEGLFEKKINLKKKKKTYSSQHVKFLAWSWD